MSDSSRKAVFLSYASQDAAAAKRLCASLRSAGIEVWFDAEGGLEHGDEWDAKIRRQVKDCLLFIPLISANTQARAEGYFRIEWELAAERAVGIASGVPFLLPMVIDDTREPDALVPDRFRRVQWTRVPDGQLADSAQTRLLNLYRSRIGQAPGGPTPSAHEWAAAPTPQRRAPSALWFALVGLIFAVGIGVFLWRRPATSSADAAAISPTVAQARQKARRAIEMSTEHYDANLADYRAAEGLMQEAIRLAGDDPQVLGSAADLNYMFYNRGFNRTEQRVDLAKSQAEQALALDPTDPEASFVMGTIMGQAELPEKAVAHFRQALKSRPDFTRAKLWLGAALIRSNLNPTEGLRLLNEVAQDPKWGALADYFEFMHHFANREFPAASAEAAHGFARAPAVNSLVARAIVRLAWQGDARGALADLQRDGKAYADAPRVVWATAQLQLDLRRPDDALATLNRLHEPYVHESYFVGPRNLLIGRALAQAGRKDAAQVAFEAALNDVKAEMTSESTDVAKRLALGEVCAELGRIPEALAEANAVLGLDAAHNQIDAIDRTPARIYAILGRADLAVPLLATGLTATTGGWPITRAGLRADPIWDPIRQDPAFAALVAEK